MRAVTFLTDGFETTEALAVVDILRRAGIQTELLSVTGSIQVRSAQDITIEADGVLQQEDHPEAELYFLPGGPGTPGYEKNKHLLELLREQNRRGKCIAAICAAPSILGHLGILQGKKATCFPGFEKELLGAECIPAPVRVVQDGSIITARGMGAAIDLGLKLVEQFLGEESAAKIGRGIQYLDS